MRLHFWTLAVLLLLPLTGVAAPVPEAAPTLARVPASAPLVVHLKGVEGVRDRLVAFWNTALPELAPFATTLFNGWVNDGYDGRKLRGLAKDGPHFLVFLEMPKPNDEPKVALLVATTDYRQFRDNLLKGDERNSVKSEDGIESAVLEHGETYYFLDRKDFAVIARSKAIAASFRKDQRGLNARISRDQAAALLSGDLSAYVSMDTLNKEYAEQIKQAREFLKQTLEAAREGAGGEPTRQDQLYFAMGEKMLAAGFQAVEDSQGIVASLQFRPQALAIHIETELRGGTSTSKALADSKPSAFSKLAELPDKQIFYIGQNFGESLRAALRGLPLGLLEGEGDEGKPLRAAVESYLNAGPGERIDSVGLPIDGVQVAQYARPAEALAAQLAVFAALKPGSTIESGMLKEAPKITREAEKLDGQAYHRVDLVWDIEKMAEGLGQQLPEEMRKKAAEAFKRLLGERRSVWMTANDRQVVRVVATDWATAKKLLAACTGQASVGESDLFRAARKEMPGESSYLALFDLVPYAVAVLDFTRPFLPFQPPPLPKNFLPGYVGFAVTLKADRGSADFVLTATAIHRAFQYVQLVQQAGGQ